MEIKTGVMLSDFWMVYNFDVPVGNHKLEWVYKKFNQFGISDDLSAEIEYIKIRGVKQMIKEC